MTDLLLVNPPIFHGTGYQSNIGLAIIASYLSKSSYDVKIYDMDADLEQQNSREARVDISMRNLMSEANKTDYLGFVTMTSGYPLVLQLLKEMKSSMRELPTIIVGGVHPSSLPVDTISDSGGLIDIAVIGAGEEPLKNILDGKKLETINNIAYSKNGNVKVTKRKLYSPFDGKIETDFLESCVTTRKDWISLSEITSIGCSNFCDYCACPKVIKTGGVFYRDSEIVAEEISEINSRFRLNEIYFIDDNHFLNVKKVEEVNALLEELDIVPIKKAFLDPSLIGSELVKNMEKWNYADVFIGRDFITNRLASIYGRKWNGKIRDVESERKKIDYLISEYPNINLSLSYIVPASHYFLEDIEKTVDEFVRYINYEITAGPLIPYPGTPIRRKLLKEGLVLENQEKNWIRHQGAIDQNLCKLLDEKVEKWYSNLKKLYYLSAYQMNVNETVPPNNWCAYLYMISTFHDSKLEKTLQRIADIHDENEANYIKEFMKFSKEIESSKIETEKFIEFIRENVLC